MKCSALRQHSSVDTLARVGQVYPSKSTIHTYKRIDTILKKFCTKYNQTTMKLLRLPFLQTILFGSSTRE
jgi:hypothetical protein